MLRRIVSRPRSLARGIAQGAGSLALAFIVVPALPATAAAETGIASIYSSLGVTASGRSYKTSDFVAAHKTLPLGSIVRVENLRNGRTATVTIVDRGPYISGRIIDVTPSVADSLGFRGQGLTPTRIAVVGRGASTGPYDRRGSASGSSVASVSSSSGPAPAQAKPTRTASAARTAVDTSLRTSAMRDGS